MASGDIQDPKGTYLLHVMGEIRVLCTLTYIFNGCILTRRGYHNNYMPPMYSLISIIKFPLLHFHTNQLTQLAILSPAALGSAARALLPGLRGAQSASRATLPSLLLLKSAARALGLLALKVFKQAPLWACWSSKIPLKRCCWPP